MSKRKEIGQCKECFWYKPVRYNDQITYKGECMQSVNFWSINRDEAHMDFGCIYWKEKKK